MNRVLLHHMGSWLEWSTILDVPVTTGMGRDDMRDLLTARGEPADEVERALDAAERNGTSIRDQRQPGWGMGIGQLVAGNRAGPGESEMPENEIVRRYLVERETLY